MKSIIAVVLVVCSSQVFGNLLDIFDQEGDHEPRVAINCKHVPFHVDLKLGNWVSDKNGKAVCDTNKEDVKRYCQKVYPKLNITNIVEANKPVKIENWCEEESEQCTATKEVVPYRCLVEEYEADALMVPSGCKFNHLHDQDSCMTHDEWKQRAVSFCRRKNFKLNEYAILLSCGTDLFTGVEFVCCPKNLKKERKHRKGKKHNKNRHIKKRPHHIRIDRVAFEKALKEFQKYMPMKTEGCDRTLYEVKRQKLEDRHSVRIAAVVDEWNEAESRYKKLKVQDSDLALKKMNKTLKAFKETLRALERDAKEERNRLKTEHSDCITTHINKQKREAMLAYIAAVEEKPHNAKTILKTARKFFKECEHDRLHSLRHFQHLQSHRPLMAEEMRDTLLTHLHELNQAVNASINILSYLPDVAKQFGLEAFIKLETPEVPKLIDPVHSHKDLPKKFKEAVHKIKTAVNKEHLSKVLKELPKHEDHIISHKLPKHFEHHIKHKVAKEQPEEKKQEPVEETVVPEKETRKPVEEESENGSRRKIASGTLNPTDMPPKTKYDSEGIPEDERLKKTPVQVPRKMHPGKSEKPVDKKTHDHGHLFFKHPKSPAAFAAVIGLSCGALIIMLGSIIALVMRRNRASASQVVVVDAEPEDQEHLIKMQRSGYENPTYKFFYY